MFGLEKTREAGTFKIALTVTNARTRVANAVGSLSIYLQIRDLAVSSTTIKSKKPIKARMNKVVKQ